MCQGYQRAKSGFELRTQGHIVSIGSTAEDQFLPSPSRWTLPLGKCRKNSELILCSDPQQTRGLPRVLLGTVSHRPLQPEAVTCPQSGYCGHRFSSVDSMCAGPLPHPPASPKHRPDPEPGSSKYVLPE